MKNIACCIFAHEITKGMKSYGSICLLKAKKNSKELLFHNISSIRNISKNIFLLLGFDADRIVQKIDQHKMTYLSVINNDSYLSKNDAYAFKLAVKKILSTDISKIAGVLFVNQNIILKKMPSFLKDKSWVLIDKKSNKSRYNIGCFIEDNILKYMFYNISNNYWTEMVYLTIDDIKTISQKINDLYYDNMFMFEVINTAIEKQNIVFNTIQLDRTADLIKINGIKDKSKIK